ncbi:MAG: hypothetical protein ACRD2T_03275 [Thermoanaerobaculia bacterium]
MSASSPPGSSAVLLALLAAGCAGPAPAGGAGAVQGPTPLRFESDLLVPSAIVHHEVQLLFEMERKPRKGEEPLVGRLKEPGEVLTAGYPGDPVERYHRFAFEEGHFIVGEYRYPALRGASLCILRERQDPLRFTFRERRITVEGKPGWKPAILYRLVQERTEIEPLEASTGRRPRRQTRSIVMTKVVREEVQVGPHRITLAPGAAELEVNGQKVAAPPGAAVAIDRRGTVTTSG